MAPVHNRPVDRSGVNHQPVRPDTDQLDQQQQTALRGPSGASRLDSEQSEAARRYVQDQAQRLGALQQGGAQHTSQATQASCMAPSAYCQRYGACEPASSAVAANANARPDIDQTDFANAFRDKAQMQMVLDEFMNRCPQLKEIQAGVKAGRLPKLVLVFAVMILKQRKETDDLMGRMADVEPNANGEESVDQNLMMAEVTNDMRDYARLQDTGANALLSMHQSQQNTIRSIRNG